MNAVLEALDRVGGQGFPSRTDATLLEELRDVLAKAEFSDGGMKLDAITCTKLFVLLGENGPNG